MEMRNLGGAGLSASPVALGCMRMHTLAPKQAAEVITASWEAGINFFDHADVYGGGESERIFGQALRETGLPRERMFLQSKCGIRKGFFDFSKEHILQSVDGSLSRLGTDYLDILLLHRPDALMEPEEVAEAFDRLHQSGKVRYFGVSNQHPGQIELLKQAVRHPLIINQLQFSPVHSGMVDCGMDVNMQNDQAVQRDGMVLDYCRLHGMTIQAWSPFQYGRIEGVFLGNPRFAGLTETIRAVAAEKGISDSAVVVNWILRHPARMQVIVGSMNPQRLRGICEGTQQPLNREEWYRIYSAAGNPIP